MEGRNNEFSRKYLYEAYVNQINWDWLFFKASVICGVAFVAGLIFFLFWQA